MAPLLLCVVNTTVVKKETSLGVPIMKTPTPFYNGLERVEHRLMRYTMYTPSTFVYHQTDVIFLNCLFGAESYLFGPLYDYDELTELLFS